MCYGTCRLVTMFLIQPAVDESRGDWSIASEMALKDTLSKAPSMSRKVPRTYPFLAILFSILCMTLWSAVSVDVPLTVTVTQTLKLTLNLTRIQSLTLVYKIPYRRAPRLAYVRPLSRVRRANKGILHTTLTLIPNTKIVYKIPYRHARAWPLGRVRVRANVYYIQTLTIATILTIERELYLYRKHIKFDMNG